MQQLPRALRDDLAARRVCRSSDDPRARVLVSKSAQPFLDDLAHKGGALREMCMREAVVELACAQVGRPYQNRAQPQEAPSRFSCSTLTKWVFGRIGIWLPRYAVDQSYVGRDVAPREADRGDLLFFPNRFPIDDIDRSIGHVALLATKDEIIHGSSREQQIVRETIDTEPVRACRVVPDLPAFLATLPAHVRDLETALDVVRWLQR